MKKIRKQIISIISVVFLVLGICSVAAVTGIPFDTGMNDVYVSPAGNDTSGDGTQANPYQTIGQGISKVNAGGTVHLADGTYQGEGNRGLIITKNVNIIGESQTGTVIDAQGAEKIFTVNSGVTVKIQKLTLENGNVASNGGAIANYGTLTVTDSTFSNNIATGSNFGEGGGAIYNNGTLTINSGTFTGNNASYNGGAIDNQQGTLNVTDSTFTSNTAGGGGAIASNGGSATITRSKFTNNKAIYSTTGGGGGAILILNTITTVNDSTFTNNTSPIWYGGAIAKVLGTLTITGTTFKNNSASYGGAISSQGNYEIHFSTITGNTALRGSATYNFMATVNAENNWWGSNDDPRSIPNAIYTEGSSFDADPYLKLNVNASPDSINPSESSAITADLTYNSNNQDTSSQGHVPDGIPVQFQTNLGTITSSSTTSNGIATATFQAGTTSGPANVQAIVDSQTVGTTVTVGSANQAPVANAGDDQTVNHNDLVTLNGSGSSDPDGDTLTYSWTLTAPTGSSATLSDPTSANPTFTPDLPGTYTAQLTVTDNKGAVSTQDTVEVNALNRNPIANIGDPYQDNEGSAITFNAGASNDPDGDTLTYQWDLNGDGIFESTGQTVSKTWEDNYTGTVTLKVTDPYGGINTTSTTVTVKNVAPTVTMGTVKQPDPFFILPTQNLTFNGSFTDPGWLDTHTATWNFGDGTTATANLTEENNAPDSTGTVTANHVYTKPGNYTVTLTVTDKDGGSSAETTQVKVISATDADIILNNYIQGLPASAFTDSASQQKKTISNKINEINQKITAKDYKGALSRLSDLRDKSDSSLGGNPKNDWIKDPTAQKDITKMIDDIIAYIKTL